MWGILGVSVLDPSIFVSDFDWTAILLVSLEKSWCPTVHFPAPKLTSTGMLSHTSILTSQVLHSALRTDMLIYSN